MAGDGAAPPPGSSTLARVRCWGVAFFRGDGGTHSSRAAAAGSGAEHSSGRSSAAAGSSSGAAAGMSGEPTEEVHMQLARAGTDAAVQALEAISAGEERMSAGEPGTAVSHLQVMPCIRHLCLSPRLAFSNELLPDTMATQVEVPTVSSNRPAAGSCTHTVCIDGRLYSASDLTPDSTPSLHRRLSPAPAGRWCQATGCSSGCGTC